MKDKYTAQWFINKFKKIPSSKWITGSYSGGPGKHCSLGFLGAKNERHAENIPAALAFMNLFSDNGMTTPQSINDDCYVNITSEADWLKRKLCLASELFGRSPKERILTALENIKGMQLTPST